MTTIGREALAEINLLIAQGADYQVAMRYKTDGTPVDLTGWQARTQLRRKVGGDIWLNVDTESTGQAQLTLTAEGVVTLTIPAAVTENPAWDSRSKVTAGEPQPTGVWDLELIDPSGIVTRLAQGTVTISPDVTRTR